MTSNQIKTRAFWLRFFGILFGAPLVMGALAGALYLMMTDAGPWILGAGFVACAACLAHDIGRRT